MNNRKPKAHEATHEAPPKAWQDVDARKTVVTMLRNVTETIQRTGQATVFPACEPDDAPFVDWACDVLERGGMLDAPTLASLVRYSADLMEE